VIEAARQLFAERGIDRTSMDAIARLSGVSKATIYKHWSDKDGLCLEVMADLHGFEEALPDIDTGDLRADLLSVVGREPPAEFADARQRILPHFMAYASRHPEFGKAWRTRVLEPPRQQLVRIIERAIRRGDLSSDLDVDFAIGLLLGPPMYWYMRKQMAPATAAPPDRRLLVHVFVKALGTRAIGLPAVP
jgi:AcrR family transcriptional regulator